jgi:hypothetical protein
MIKIASTKRHKVELVVAHYKENIAWLKCIKHNKMIYHKGNLNVKNAITLKNFGRESHSYLHHIVTRYKCLADVTIFCQANPFDHCPNFIHLANHDDIMTFNKLQEREPNPNFAPFAKMVWRDSVENLQNDPWSNQYRLPYIPIVFNYLFPKHEHPSTFYCPWGAMFAVSKQQLHKFTLEQYKYLLHLHEIYWSMPWAMEIIWLHLLHPSFQPKPIILI